MRTVTGIGEFIVRCRGTLRVGAFCANGTYNRRVLQVRDVSFWGIRIIARFADIVDVEVTTL